MKKFMALTLMLVLVVTMIPLKALAEEVVATTSSNEFTDMPADWSTEALVKAVENGLLTGYDGKIMPKENLTRAQMATIINRSFGATEKASLARFTDVDSSMWFYDEMAKAVNMKTFQGSNDNKLNPEAAITREEAFVVLARAFKLAATDKVPAGFNDLNDISSWAKGEVYSLINSGYIAGSNGYINPKANITRAEFAQVMHNILKTYIKEAGEYTNLPAGNVMVNVPGVTLKDVVIEGDLIVGDGVGDGDLTLENVDVKGRMVVRGGGANSIIIKGASKLGQVIIARIDGSVRVVVEEGTNVEVITVDDGNDTVIIEGDVDQLSVQAETPVVLRNANINSIAVETEKADVTIEKGSKVEKLVVNTAAKDSKIVVEGSIKEATVQAPSTSIEGTGEVEKVSVKSAANNTTITTPNTAIATEKGVSGVTGTGGAAIPADSTATNNKDADKPAKVEEVKEEEKPSTDGGGGGGGGTPAPTAITLESATIGSGTALVSSDGKSVDVTFDLESAPGTITATFNRPVVIEKISIGGVTIDNIPGGPIKFDAVKDKVEEGTKTLSLSVNTTINQNHLDLFGHTVKVIVADAQNSSLKQTITINLIGQ